MENEKNLNQNEEVKNVNDIIANDKKKLKDKFLKIAKLSGRVLIGALATVGVAAVAVTTYNKLHTEKDETDYLEKLEETYPEQDILSDEINREAE